MVSTQCLFSGDLDDGMGKFTDEAISKDDEAFQGQKNTAFIKMKARAAAGVSGKADAASGGANINSVILGAGSNVKGDIIIIDQSKGDKTILSE